MTRSGAQSAVVLSAFVTAGIFAYRKFTEPASSPTGLIAGVPQTAHFLLGWMVVYTTLSIVAAAAPPLGGMFAILVGAGDLLVNGQAITSDITKGLNATATATAPSAPAGSSTTPSSTKGG
jgi:hypothetical protein